MTNENVVKTLVDQVFRIVERFEKQKTLFPVVIISKASNNTYEGYINGQVYDLPNGTDMTFKVGDKVIVCIPDGDYKRRFIMARKPN